MSGPIGTLAAVLQLDAPLPWLHRPAVGRLDPHALRARRLGAPVYAVVVVDPKKGLTAPSVRKRGKLVGITKCLNREATWCFERGR